MEAFKHTLEDCQLNDLGFQGPKFTWNNSISGYHFTKERLDRAIANKEWCELFLAADVSVEAARTSDHSPVLLTLKKSSETYKKRGFRFEASWGAE
ncbi:hypothetical protein SLA2020_439500 [Shorea laevis]